MCFFYKRNLLWNIGDIKLHCLISLLPNCKKIDFKLSTKLYWNNKIKFNKEYYTKYVSNDLLYLVHQFFSQSQPKVDRVALLITDSSPTSFNILSRKNKKKKVTCFMWHVTRDRWHMTVGGMWTFSQTFSSLALTVLQRRLSEDLRKGITEPPTY